MATNKNRLEQVRQCEVCGEGNPATFATCWHCESSLEGAPVMGQSQSNESTEPEVREKASADRVPLRALSSERSVRVSLVEMSVVLLVFWVPAMAWWFTGWEKDKAIEFESGLLPTLYDLGTIAMSAYLLWLSGSWKSLCARRLPLVKGFVLVCVILWVQWLSSHVTWSVASMWNLPQWESDHRSATVLTITGLTSMTLSVVAEEVFYRGYLLTRLRDIKLHPVLVLTIASACFVVPHYYSPFVSLSVFAAGLVYGTAVMLSRNLWVVVMAHWLWNLTIFL